MPICYVIPGFLASEINTVGIVDLLLWVNVPRLIIGEFGKLRLAANGIDPGPPDGAECVVGPGLADYTVTPANVLQEQLGPHGYTVTVWPWDWRKELVNYGALLAAKIRTEVSPANPCSLVAHSTGGLIARLAWGNLKGTNQENLVRRIVTLGTPHQGTYRPVMVFSTEDPLIRQLLFLNLMLGMTPVARIPGYTRWSNGSIRTLCESWPSLYQLLPALPAPVWDPHRPAIYQNSNWTQGANPQQVWLDNAAESFWPLLNSPDYMPPAWVLTTVSGKGTATQYRLIDPQDLGDPNAIAATFAGDGIVTEQSALVEDSWQYKTTIAHIDQLPQLATSGKIAEWVLAERDPPSPAPPPASVAQLQPATYAGPPISSLGFPNGIQSYCSLGNCSC